MWRNSDGKICECEKMEEPPGLSLLPEKKPCRHFFIAQAMFEEQRESEEIGRSI